MFAPLLAPFFLAMMRFLNVGPILIPCVEYIGHTQMAHLMLGDAQLGTLV